jgi:hypothetical protein
VTVPMIVLVLGFESKPRWFIRADGLEDELRVLGFFSDEDALLDALSLLACRILDGPPEGESA